MHQYFLMFLLLLVGGESILIPAIYLTLIDIWSIPAVIAIALIATVISDSIWYLIGRHMSLERIEKMRWLRKNKNALTAARRLFQKYGAWCVVLSKFLYGTRIAVQVLSGMEKMPYLRYTVVNTFGVALWIAVLYAIGLALRQSLGAFEHSIQYFQIVFGGSFLIIIGIMIWLNHRWGKKWFQ